MNAQFNTERLAAGTILLTDIHPNDWNPNRMTVEEHDELVAEIKHLGRVPKPVVLRRNETEYEIIDGEQAYHALIELAWKELQPGQYELIEADDFEAMRQTYKRNQHGTHDKLKEGLLFRRLMVEKGLSNRELAEQVEVSEGTIRNALEYVKAVEVRNSYAEWKINSLEKQIAELSVRDARAVNEMPIEMGDLWLDGGARAEDLPGPGWYAHYDPKLAVLIPMMHVQTCRTAIDRMREVAQALRLWGYYQHTWKSRVGKAREWMGGLKLDVEAALPYLKLLLKSRWFKKWDEELTVHWLRNVMEAISRPDGDKAKIILPLDAFEAWIDYPDPMNFPDFREKLRTATAEIETPVNGAELWRDQLQKYAPAEIKNSNLPVEQAYKLWQALRTSEEDGVKKEVLDQALARTIAEAQPKSEPAELLDSIIRELTAEAEVETEITSLGDKAAMLEQAKELITYIAKTNAMFAGMSQDPNAKKRFEKLLKSMEPMLDRLAALQEPELALIIAMLTGKNWLKIWATAIGWKFENSIVDIKAI